MSLLFYHKPLKHLIQKIKKNAFINIYSVIEWMSQGLFFPFFPFLQMLLCIGASAEHQAAEHVHWERCRT